MTQQSLFRTFTLYNRWANNTIFAAASDIPDAERKKDRGAFFSSLHGTLNHVLIADMSWRSRLEGRPGELGRTLSYDTILHEDFDALKAARRAEDQALVDLVFGLDEADFDVPIDYATSRGEPHSQPRAEILAHVFNHQTHHRGQAHDLIQQINAKAPPLDLLVYHRFVASKDAP